MQRKVELDTPCLLIDRQILLENIDDMQQAVSGVGKALRPHAKTHKCSHIARLQLERGAVGLCTAKLSEAEVLAAENIGPLLITGPIAGRVKIKRLVELLAKAPDLILTVDSLQCANELSRAVTSAGLSLSLLIDLDVGLHRTGVQTDMALTLARGILELPGLVLKGIQAYAGHVQHIQSYDERRQCSLQVLKPAEQIYREIDALASIDIFSAGGTGTFDIDTEIESFTDLQAGSYVFMDAEYQAIGSAADPQRNLTFRPALRLLTTVVSTNYRGWVTVDAGLKTMYQNGGQPFAPDLAGYGYTWFGDEFGKIIVPEGAIPPQLGDKIELVVSHCDPTVNLFDFFYIVENGNVLDRWACDLRGKSQ